MSTRVPHKITPELPPEIWAEILDEAMAVPDPLQPPLRVVWPVIAGANAHRRWRQAIVTRRYIVRVCKDWYRMAIPKLYEHLVLTRLRHPAMLLESASTIPLVEGADESPLGVYTKRLDINVHNLSDSNVHEAVDAIGLLLENLPSLTTLIFTCKEVYNAVFSDSDEVFLGNASQTLEYIVWNTEMGSNDIDCFTWLAFMWDHPNLNVVGSPRLGTPTQDIEELQINPNVVFPLPRELGVRRIWEADTHFIKGIHPIESGPRTMSIFLSKPRPDIVPFLVENGAELTTLHIFYDLDMGEAYHVQNILDHCPTLHTFVISDYSHVRLDTLITAISHPKLTVLEIDPMVQHGQVRSQVCKQIFGALASAKTSFRSLQAIRFMDGILPEHFRRSHADTLDRALAHFQQLGVRIEGARIQG